MATIRKQYYGIKFPFTSNNRKGFFLDLNTDMKQKTESEIAHVLLTPKGSRLRMPDFGTNLAQFIFNPNDNTTWENIKTEINEAISKYVPRVDAVDVNVENNGDERGIQLTIKYAITRGNYIENNEFVVNL